MRAGYVDSASRSAIVGWAANDQNPDARLQLRVEVDGVEVGRVFASRPRKDLAKLGRFGDGAHGFIYTFAEPLSPERDHSISVLFFDGKLLPNGAHTIVRETAVPPTQSAADLAHAAGLDQPIGPDQPPGLSPILVTAPGRSGTTYLMSCLAASPQIVITELIPYEMRLLSYYATAFEVLGAPANTDRSTHPDKLQGDGFHVGFNPFSANQYAAAFQDPAPLLDYHANYAPARIGRAMADVVQEYYRRLAADRGKPAIFFAEKNNNLHRPPRMFMRRGFPGAREIVIVRDPRDVLCSHVSYFSSTRDRAFKQLTHSNQQITALVAEALPDVLVVRYEDMITGQAETFERLSTFLGTEIRPAQAESGSHTFARHATSASPEASMGRWRRDLPPRLQSQCSKQWGEFLVRFGYEEG